MVIAHFLIFALLISFWDLRRHRIYRSHNYAAIMTLIPLVEFRAFWFAAHNLIIYLFIRILSRQELGKGDVRLSPLMGMYTAIYSFELSDLFFLNFITWILAAVVALAVMACRRRNRLDRMAFAPFMFCGVLIHAYVNSVAKNCSLSAIITQCVG